MALCRIYVFTYKRHKLLPRAVQSLISQTFTDWVCEVHNDDPEDLFPAEYVEGLNDERFIIKNHAKNLGGNASFNLAFAGCEEKYGSILEDDNWWEPEFLAEMTRLMDQSPNLDVAWSNMKIWKEGEGNTWTDTGKTVWPAQNDLSFTWPQPKQALGALHSTGAMIYRSINAPKYVIPNETLLDSVELVRERAFKHPIYLHSKALANFSVTAFTNRSGKSWKWAASLTMQLSSMVMAADNRGETFSRMLKHYRNGNPGVVVSFFLANRLFIKDRSLYKYLSIKDWFACAKWLIKNNPQIAELKKYLNTQTGVYDFLLTNTRERYKESVAG